MNYIKGFCRTNLDDYERYRWPQIFVAIPLVGERVEAIDGMRSLKVVCVTHCFDSKNSEPFLRIELHK